MKHLTYEQIKNIPWNSKYLKGGDYPAEPEPGEVSGLVEVPFMKRDSRYVLFYCWNEIINMIEGSHKRILDTACGRGQISQVLHYYGHEVKACDIEDIFGADNEIEFKTADLNLNFPYKEESFDYVLNSTALHYLDDTRHYFEECRRVLAKGGHVVFSIPNIESFGNRLYFLKKGKFSEYSSAVLNRKNFIYPDYLFALLEELQFNVTDIRGVVPVKSKKISLANLLIGNRIFKGKSDYLKYSPILVIKAKLKS